MPEWTAGGYVRVYLGFTEDHPEVFADDHLLAWWVRLLMAARDYTALWPAAIPEEVATALVALGVVDRVGPMSYRIHGAEKLREANAYRGQAGGRARARGPRDPLGRLLGRDAGAPAGQSNGNAGAVMLADPLGPADGGDPASSVPSSDLSINTYTSSGPPLRSGPEEVGEISSRAGAGAREDGPPDLSPFDPLGPTTVGEYRAWVRNHGPDDAPCDEPDLHALHHRWYPGVGWRCLLCEHSDSRTFADRMATAQANAKRAEEVADDSRPF